MKSKQTKEVFLIEALGHACAHDVKTGGKTALSKGAVINTRVVASLAAMGIDRVSVYDKPQVSVLVIGDDLMAPGVPPRPGKTYDPNNPMLQAALESMRIRPVFIRRLEKEPKTLRRLVPFALNQSDILIIVMKEVENAQNFIRGLLGGMNAQIISLMNKSDSSNARIIEDKGKKLVFCLPYDSNLIFKRFYQYIQPAIQLFMGYTLKPAKGKKHVD